MVDFNLKGYKVKEYQFINKINGMKKLELSHKYSYNVGYSQNNTCKSEFRAEITDKEDPEAFRIVMLLEAFFQINGDTPKEVLHVETYDAVFPYVKSIVSATTSLAGIPPVIIPYVDIRGQDIYRVEIPKNNDK